MEADVYGVSSGRPLDIAQLRTLDVQGMARVVFENTDLRETTRRTYSRAIKHFATWFELGAESQDAATLVRFKNELAETTSISAATKNLYLSAARVLYRRLYEIGAIERDLSSSVRPFVIPQGHKRSPISDDDVAKVYRYLASAKDPRLVAIFDLLFRQGLRQREIVTLRVGDLDFAAGVMLVQGKGRDDREPVFLHPATSESLRGYIERRQLSDGYVFYSLTNPRGHLTTVQLYRIVMKVHEALGINGSVHAYRKVFTSKLIESGMNLLVVQRYTRHRSTEMLRVYYDRLDQKKTLNSYFAALSVPEPAIAPESSDFV